MGSRWRGRIARVRAGAIASRIKSGVVKPASLGSLQKPAEQAPKWAGPRADWQAKCEEAIQRHASEGTLERKGFHHGKLMDLVDHKNHISSAGARLVAIRLLQSGPMTQSELLGFLKENGFCRPGLESRYNLQRTFLRPLSDVGLLRIPRGVFKVEPQLVLLEDALSRIRLQG